jgi:hypothetical protein
MKKSVLKNGRLPSTLKPLVYNLTMAVDVESSRLVGSVVIEVESVSREPVSEVWLHADAALEFEKNAERVLLESGEDVLADWTYFPDEQAVRVGLKKPIGHGAKAKVLVDYSTTFSDKLVGFYRVRYSDAGQTK